MEGKLKITYGRQTSRQNCKNASRVGLMILRLKQKGHNGSLYPGGNCTRLLWFATDSLIDPLVCLVTLDSASSSPLDTLITSQ
ncbi:hypothetical protein RRG08_032044 [Elysia crispata]|uniref:Uncharacterized protein n=1 Tax=Elysia crispata TaxID=231223 RepID=A0AAE1CMU3_9GAST|nr:hypothetical protein RRG08_032044 [Elysia crispata]